MRDAAPPTTRADGLVADRRTLSEEVAVVLSLSLLHSAVDALLSLLEAPVSRNVAVAIFPSFDLARQLISIVFALAPVALVLHLIRRSGEGWGPFGLDVAAWGSDARMGVVLAAAVSAVGLGLYVGAIALNINRFVIPVPPLGHWWTVPVLLLGAAQNAALEEVIVVGYLIRRLEQLGLATVGALAVSAVLRASYHLYQGWGGFAGNLLLGVFFGAIFLRWRRTWPLVVAHFLIDSAAGVAYIAFRGHCLFSLCIR
ncbi:MAG TPA: CPBP family intramembrane glutamic endopeptidase [Actinomycetota bacterium]|nr:CPBP family intramembrane glutamic endopeptidase [Actinomycetota bacterium]